MSMSVESYNIFMEQGKSAPCNGCCHEVLCRTGFTCQMYRKWEKMKPNEWRRDHQNYNKIPDRPYGRFEC